MHLLGYCAEAITPIAAQIIKHLCVPVDVHKSMQNDKQKMHFSIEPPWLHEYQALNASCRMTVLESWIIKRKEVLMEFASNVSRHLKSSM